MKCTELVYVVYCFIFVLLQKHADTQAHADDVLQDISHVPCQMFKHFFNCVLCNFSRRLAFVFF